MKNLVIIVLLVAAIALGALFVSQQNKAKKQAAELAQTQAQLATAEAQAQGKTEAAEKTSFAENKARILQDTLKATAANVVAQSNQVAQLQLAAKSYGAEYTPEVYLLDATYTLRYNGRIDDNWQNPKGVKVHDLRTALDELLAGKPVSNPLSHAIGCSVKWKF